MPPSTADSETLALIRRLAEGGTFCFVSRQARSDLMAHNLRQGDITDAIVDLINAGGRVKPVTLHSFPGREGTPAYEIKPKINSVTWYTKICIDHRGEAEECLALISAHVDH